MISTNYIKHTNKNALHRAFLDDFNYRIISLIESINPKVILDAGCGEGFYLNYMNCLGNKFGVDYCPYAILEAKKTGLNSLSRADIRIMPFQDAQFGLVLCLEVLEHLERPENAIRELERISSRYIIISVPLEPHFRLAALIRGKYLDSFGNHPEHFQQWSFKGFKRFLSAHSHAELLHHEIRFPWQIVLLKK